MVDTHRFNLGPVCVELVTEVAAELAQQHPDHLIHILQLTTYLPLDVQSVTRIVESLEEDEDMGIEREQKDSLSWVRIPQPERYIHRALGLESGAEFGAASGLHRTIAQLKSGPDWERKMREEHQVLRVAANAKNRTIELAYLTRRLDLPSAKIQSILNDFQAEGHIALRYDEDTDTLWYTFPQLDYPKALYERNMSIQAEAEPREVSTTKWAILGVAVFGLVLIALLVKLSIG